MARLGVPYGLNVLLAGFEFEATRPYMEAIWWLGDALRELEDFDGAREKFERLLKMDPADNLAAEGQIRRIDIEAGSTAPRLVG